MFDNEFYPTPRHVLDEMGIDCYGKVVLEPSAGKGDIVDYCKEWGASEVLVCEKNNDLKQIVASKGTFLKTNFFDVKSEDISHVQLIVMNPPFSLAHRHILHAWHIAPEGCEIIALCNWETVNNIRGYGRSELYQLVEDYGEKANLGDCFSKAERKTGVEVALVRLFKPVLNDSSTFDDFYLSCDSEVEDNAIISFNEIKAVVNTYTAAVRCFDKVEQVAKELAAYTHVKFVGKEKEDGTHEVHELSFGMGIAFRAAHRDDGITTKAQFGKAFQMQCWQFIFSRVGIEKYVTKGVLNDVNTFISNRKNYPFTVKNISKMLDIIVGTRGEIMNRAIVEAVDNFTRYTHENRYGVEGWKTNSGHLINKKFIADWVAENSYGGGLGFRTYNSRSFDYLIDLTKALCFLTGIKFEDIPNPHYLPKVNANTWHEWGFFQYKFFKKGSGHFKFKDENVWATLNRAYAKIKGHVLPEKI